MIRQRRRIHRGRRPLPERVRDCGRQGVARAQQALEHPEPEQLSFDDLPPRRR